MLFLSEVLRSSIFRLKSVRYALIRIIESVDIVMLSESGPDVNRSSLYIKRKTSVIMSPS